MTAIALPTDLTAFAKAVVERGGRSYVTGAAVVECISDRTPSRFDLSVFGLDPKTIAGLVDDAVGSVTGRSQVRSPFVTPDGTEIVIAAGAPGRRRSRSAAVGLPGEAIEAALRGRNFTVEMILCDPLTGHIEDPFGGVGDLERGRLAIAGTPSEYNPATPFRGASLAARHGLSLDPATAVALRRDATRDVPLHFVWRSLEEILVDADRPSIGLDALLQMGALAAVAPELAALSGQPEDPRLHPEGDAWVHTRLVTNEARILGEGLPRASRFRLSLAALCHDIGKPRAAALVGQRLATGGHDRLGAELASSMLARLGAAAHIGADGVDLVVALVRHHLIPARLYRARHRMSARLGRRIARRLDIDLLYRLALSDGLGRGEPARSHHAAEWFRDCFDTALDTAGCTGRLVDGSDIVALGAHAGPQARAVVEAVRGMQLSGTLGDRETAHDEAGRLVATATQRVRKVRARPRPAGRADQKTLTDSRHHD